MNFKTIFLRIIRKQECLYLWGLLLLLLPSLALLITDHIFSVELPAFLLLPAACYMLIMLLFGRPGYGVVLMAPLLIIGGSQLVFLYMFGGSVISADMFLNLTSSNSSETAELMNTLWPVVLAACLVYLPPLAWGVYSIFNRQKLSGCFVRVMLVVSAVCLIWGSISVYNSSHDLPDYKLETDIYPLNVVYNMSFAGHKAWHNKLYPTSIADFRFDAVRKDKKSRDREIYVLVIGETSRAANWSLYGYERETNPLLSAEPNLVIYQDVLTQGNITHRIVPMILSSACAENFNIIYEQKSLISAFKEVGFTTFFVSNQTPNRSFIDYFAGESDSLISILPMQQQLGRPTYDTDMVPLIKQIIGDQTGDLLFVLHTYGSHFDYKGRYPREYAVFQPDAASRLSVQFRNEYVNAYDNTIRYTDLFLYQIVEALKESNSCSAMLYLSDHGEDLMDDSRNMFLHCSPTPSYYQLHVPFMFWFSDSYKTQYPKVCELAEANASQPVSSDVVFHSMLDLGHIRTAYADSTRSVISPYFHIQPRTFIGDHDNPIKIREMNLRQEDMEMIRKHHITY